MSIQGHHQYLGEQFVHGMIQRIQSIFLLLAAFSFGALFFIPLALSDAVTTQFLADQQYDITDHPVLLALTSLGTLIALGTIFLFKNRSLQLKLGYIIIVLAILLPSASFLLFMNESAALGPAAQVMDQAGMYLPALAIVFGLLANYFIKKDDRLVKSMDRLR
jgi:hypothetical protein